MILIVAIPLTGFVLMLVGDLFVKNKIFFRNRNAKIFSCVVLFLLLVIGYFLATVPISEKDYKWEKYQTTPLRNFSGFILEIPTRGESGPVFLVESQAGDKIFLPKELVKINNFGDNVILTEYRTIGFVDNSIYWRAMPPLFAQKKYEIN